MYQGGFIGNIQPLNYANTNPTDAPFCIGYGLKEYSTSIWIISYDTEESHTLKISAIPFIKKIVPQVYYANTVYGNPNIRSGSGLGSIMINAATSARGAYSFAEGVSTKSTGNFSHAEGVGTEAIGYGSHSEGAWTSALSDESHAEGLKTIAQGLESHAEGQNTIAVGIDSHSEGTFTRAMGRGSHTEGGGTYAHANAVYTHIAGVNNLPSSNTGKIVSLSAYDADGNIIPNYTVERTLGEFAEVVGNGDSDLERSNARTLDWNGNEVLSGKLTVGANPTGNMDVATKQYVDTAFSSSVTSPPEVFIGSTTPSGYTLYIDPEGMLERGEGVGF